MLFFVPDEKVLSKCPLGIDGSIISIKNQKKIDLIQIKAKILINDV